MDAQAREALRRAIAYEHLLFQEAQQADAEAERWRQRSELALRRGEEQLAQQALERQRAVAQRAGLYREQYKAQVDTVRLAKDALFQPRLPAGSTDPIARLDALAREDRLERDLADLKAHPSG
jgi:hypothetical protein